MLGITPPMVTNIERCSPALSRNGARFARNIRRENEVLRAALKSVRNSICEQSPVVIWHSDIETVFEFINTTLGESITYDDWLEYRRINLSVGDET